jgi:trehalose 6-phosphate synthase/phosphatase
MAGSRALDESGAWLPSAPIVEALAERVRAAPALLLVLDYDGTLVPFALTPELAGPDREVLTLLQDLAARPRTEVHVVSGRTQETLESWLGPLPIGLHAEHGLSSRVPSAGAWVAAKLPPQEWRPAVFTLMRAFVEETPGAFVEEKSAGLAWHYRAADPALGAVRARALELKLAAFLEHRPARILPGAKVIEVVPKGVHKGRLVPSLLARAPAEALLLAVGDDRTDEDLFGALPVGALAVHVGPGPSRAPIRLGGVLEVRALLHAIAEARPA